MFDPIDSSWNPDGLGAHSAIEVRGSALWACRHAASNSRRTFLRGVAHDGRSTRIPETQERLLGIDASALSADEAVDALVTVQAQRARLDAIELELLVRAAGATRVVRDVLVEDRGPDGQPIADREPRRIDLVDEVVEEIAAALHRSPGQVHHQVRIARLLHGPLRATRDCLADGQITMGHATVIAEQAARLASTPLGVDPNADDAFARTCAELQGRVLPHTVDETAGQTQSRCRRVVVSIDPAGAAVRRDRAKAHCDVIGRALDDGLAVIEAVLPAPDAQVALATIDAAARACLAQGTVDSLGLGADASLGQVRAAVFARLLRGGKCQSALGGATEGVRVTVDVLIDASTLAGITPDRPAWVRVGGSGSVDVSRADVLRLLDDAGTHASFRRLVTDPLTGALIDRGAHSYTATPSLRAWLQSRDVTCSHPGCTRAAARADVDHAIDFHDGGRTTIANTRMLCRRHHNLKTHANWRIDDAAPDGSCTFTSPGGRVYRHVPVRLMPERPPDSTSAPPPTPDDEPPPF